MLNSVGKESFSLPFLTLFHYMILGTWGFQITYSTLSAKCCDKFRERGNSKLLSFSSKNNAHLGATFVGHAPQLAAAVAQLADLETAMQLSYLNNVKDVYKKIEVLWITSRSSSYEPIIFILDRSRVLFWDWFNFVRFPRCANAMFSKRIKKFMPSNNFERGKGKSSIY